MHIAIVEDNIADRHQTERLLGREVDRRRTAEEGYYVDSFGSADAVLPCPTTYDIFFLDMQHTEPDGFQLMKEQEGGRKLWGGDLFDEL